MIITKTSVTVYAYLFLGIIIGWPFVLLIWSYPLIPVIVLFAINASLLALVWHYCSSPTVSFINGIHVISARLSSGCVNITVVYLFPFLVFVYLVFLFYSLTKGRKYTQDKWIQFIQTSHLGRYVVYACIMTVLVGCSIFLAVTFWPTPMRNLQAITTSMSTRLEARISNASPSQLIEYKTLPILVVWSDTGAVCVDIQTLIPTSYWPKNIDDINSGYLVGVEKTTKLVAQYGTYPSINGYQVSYKVHVITFNENRDGTQAIKEVSNTVFLGTELPNSIRVPQNSYVPYYGNPPANDTVANWIKTTLRVKDN